MQAGLEGGRPGGAALVGRSACHSSKSIWAGLRCRGRIARTWQRHALPCLATLHPSRLHPPEWHVQAPTKPERTCQGYHALHIHLDAVSAAACTADSGARGGPWKGVQHAQPGLLSSAACRFTT